MNDFEVHPKGTTVEIQLSRTLHNAIDQSMEQWGKGVMSADIIAAHTALLECYMEQQKREQQYE
jgi:hypothetical protein